MKSEFRHWYIILIVLVEYFVAVYVHKRYFGQRGYDNRSSTIQFGLKGVAKSSWGTSWTYALLLFRFFCFLWFVVAGVVNTFTRHPTSWHYFTLWNIFLLVTYYFLATAATVVYLIPIDVSSLVDPNMLKIICRVITVLFEIAGSSAVYVSCVDLVFLSANPQFSNMTLHVSTSCSQLVELMLNDMPVDIHDITIALAWPTTYLVFIFSMVLSGIRGWPYPFLDIESSSCFLWYHAMILLFGIFYTVWYFLCRIKYYLVDRFGGGNVSPVAKKEALLGEYQCDSSERSVLIL